MVITMAKLRMAHTSTHGARKPPGPKCKEKGNERFYFGETSRSAYERGREHLSDLKEMSVDSHMAKHAVVEHQGDTAIRFGMKVLKVHMTAFRRQIHEAVKIQRSQKNSILNSKGEYNCCSLPRLTVMVGNKESKEKEQEENEPLTEQEIEQEINKMRSKKRKEMNDFPRPPPSKKMKKWRLELRKELQQKRKRDFNQAEKEKEKKERKKRKNIDSKEENLSTIEAEETKVLMTAQDQNQHLTSNINSSKNEILSSVKSNLSLESKKAENENENIYFPIFKFTANRQKERGGNCHNVKANSKPSSTANHPPTRIKRKPRPKPKPNPKPSLTPNQPKQVQQSRSKGPKIYPSNLTKISQYFNPIKKIAGLNENESESNPDGQEPSL